MILDHTEDSLFYNHPAISREAAFVLGYRTGRGWRIPGHGPRGHGAAPYKPLRGRTACLAERLRGRLAAPPVFPRPCRRNVRPPAPFAGRSPFARSYAAASLRKKSTALGMAVPGTALVVFQAGNGPAHNRLAAAAYLPAVGIIKQRVAKDILAAASYLPAVVVIVDLAAEKILPAASCLPLAS